MSATLAIARLTLLEARRRRLVLAIFLLTLIAIGITALGFSRLPTINCGGRQPCSPAEVQLAAALVLILVVYMFDSVIAVGASFVAAPAIASDIESGIVLAVLPRPIRRSSVVLGKWLGLAALVAIYAGFTYALEFLVVWLTVGYVPPQPLQAVLYITGEGIVLMTLALLASTRLAPITGGVIAVVLFGIAWIGGIAQAIGVAFESTVLTNIGTIVSLILPTDPLWRNAIFSLEPIAAIAAGGASRMLAANPFFVAAQVPIAYVYWAIGWTAAILALAMYSFEKRDL